MMPGRELDAKVAESLGLKPTATAIRWVVALRGEVIDLPHFSTSWEGMGVLVEEARKQGIYLEYSHSLKGGFYGGAYSFDDGEYQMDYSTEQALPTAPHAVTLAYLMARGVISNA